MFGQAPGIDRCIGQTITTGNGGLFGQTNSTAGTVTPFQALPGTDSLVKIGVTQQISTRHQCITAMREYETKSLEELRFEDLQIQNLNHRSTEQTTLSSDSCGFGVEAIQNCSGIGTSVLDKHEQPISRGIAGLNGQTSSSNNDGFGRPNSTSCDGLFGQPSSTSSDGLFGQPSSTTSGGLFGQPSSTSSDGLFGQPSSTSSVFLFGQPSSTSSGGLFGQRSSTSSDKLFGQLSSTGSGGLIGQTNSTQSGGSFGEPGMGLTAGPFGQSRSTTSGDGFVGQLSSTGSGRLFGPAGTVTPFQAPPGADSLVQAGVTQQISTSHQCITAIREFENRSQEFPDVIDVCVGQKVFANVPLTTLTSVDTSELARMVRGQRPVLKRQNRKYILPGNGECFLAILNYLQYRELPVVANKVGSKDSILAYEGNCWSKEQIRTIHRMAKLYELNDFVSELEQMEPVHVELQFDKYKDNTPGYKQVLRRVLDAVGIDALTRMKKVYEVVLNDPTDAAISESCCDHDCNVKTLKGDTSVDCFMYMTVDNKLLTCLCRDLTARGFDVKGQVLFCDFACTRTHTIDWVKCCKRMRFLLRFDFDIKHLEAKPVML